MDQMRIESATGSHPDVRIVRLEIDAVKE